MVSLKNPFNKYENYIILTYKCGEVQADWNGTKVTSIDFTEGKISLITGFMGSCLVALYM